MFFSTQVGANLPVRMAEVPYVGQKANQIMSPVHMEVEACHGGQVLSLLVRYMAPRIW